MYNIQISQAIRMKFSGFHLHMALLVVVICLVLYIFYVSKDIVSLDKEVRVLKQKVDAIGQHQTNHITQEAIVQTMQMQKEMQLATPPRSQREAFVVEEEVDEVESINTENIQEMLTNIENQPEQDVTESGENVEENVEDENVEEEQVEEEQVEEKSLSFQELKELCKKNGLHAKGTKKQLTDLLKAHEIIV
jgi:hypothetical protein